MNENKFAAVKKYNKKIIASSLDFGDFSTSGLYSLKYDQINESSK